MKFLHSHIPVHILREFQPDIFVIGCRSDEQHSRSRSDLIKFDSEFHLHLLQRRCSLSHHHDIRYHTTCRIRMAGKHHKPLFRLETGHFPLVHSGLHQVSNGHIAVLQNGGLDEIGRCSKHIIQRTEGLQVVLGSHATEIRCLHICRHDLHLAVT